MWNVRLKERAQELCRWIPLQMWHTVCGVDLVVPVWHIVKDVPVPHASHLYQFRTTEEFEADLEFFLRRYTPVTEADLLAHVNGAGELPKRSVLFTFDDGFRECYDVIAPLLYAKGLPGIFFLTTAALDNCHLCDPQKKSILIGALSNVGDAGVLEEVARTLSVAGVSGSGCTASRIRDVSCHQRSVLDELGRMLGFDFAAYLRSARPYLTCEEVEWLLARGFNVGGHSVDHPRYPELSVEEQVAQTRESIHWLSKRFGVNCRSFAFPYGDVGMSEQCVQRMRNELGVDLWFGMGGVSAERGGGRLTRMTTEGTDRSAAQAVALDLARCFVRSRSRSQRQRAAAGGWHRES